jgi:hypothetical protein
MHFLEQGWTQAYETLRKSAMSDPDKPKQAPPLSPQKVAEKQRLAEALRENLKRRKAQARGRRSESSGNSGPEGE